MSDKATGDKPVRRSTVVLIGTLVAGAALNAALGANTVAAAPGASISEQFRTAFIPGVARAATPGESIVVTEPS